MDSVAISSKYRNYREYKEAVDTELQKTAESFVKIGYLLKVARDTDILRESGYENVNEFAKAEYGIDKTQVSRFININDRFAKEGYSDELKTEYQGFGYAKLSMMLTLPDVITEELSAAYSKEEVKAVKEEVDAERAVSELEVWMEEEKEEQKELSTVLEKAVHQLGHDNPELYVKLWKLLAAAGVEGRTGRLVRELEETLAPQGEAIYTVRIPGTGRLMLSAKGNDEVIRLINIRTEEKEEHNVWDILDILRHLNGEEGIKESGEESFKAVYGKAYPEAEKEKVAPVQLPEQKRKSSPRKESRVTKAKTEQKQVQEEEQIPGQMEVENYPEILPEGYSKEKAGTVQQESRGTVENTRTEEAAGDIEKDTEQDETENIKKEIQSLLEEISELVGVEYEDMPETERMRLGQAREKACRLLDAIDRLAEVKNREENG